MGVYRKTRLVGDSIGDSVGDSIGNSAGDGVVDGRGLVDHGVVGGTRLVGHCIVTGASLVGLLARFRIWSGGRLVFKIYIVCLSSSGVFPFLNPCFVCA